MPVKSSGAASSGTTASARGIALPFDNLSSCWSVDEGDVASSSRHQKSAVRPASRQRANSSSSSRQLIALAPCKGGREPKAQRGVGFQKNQNPPLAKTARFPPLQGGGT